MERFRELEKEFKMKPHSKRNLEKPQRQGNSEDSGSSDGGEDYDSEQDLSEGSKEEVSEE